MSTQNNEKTKIIINMISKEIIKLYTSFDIVKIIDDVSSLNDDNKFDDNNVYIGFWKEAKKIFADIPGIIYHGCYARVVLGLVNSLTEEVHEIEIAIPRFRDEDKHYYNYLVIEFGNELIDDFVTFSIRPKGVQQYATYCYYTIRDLYNLVIESKKSCYYVTRKLIALLNKLNLITRKCTGEKCVYHWIKMLNNPKTAFYQRFKQCQKNCERIRSN